MLCSLAWRALLSCACWVSFDIEGLAEFRAEIKQLNGRGAVIIGNHTSFLDTIITVAMIPLSKIHLVKMFVSPHLKKIPLLGDIVKAMNHLGVPFKDSSTTGGMEVDKEKMVELQQTLEDYVKGGGIAGWFPEGTMKDDNVLEVGQFRAGGFALCAHVDVPIWCIAFVGNATCWPKKAPVGGRPARIRMKIFKVCDHSKEYMKNGNGTFPASEVNQCQWLANSIRKQVQDYIIELAPPSDGLDGGLLSS